MPSLALHCRQLAVFPHGNGDAGAGNLSVFLEKANADALPEGWSVPLPEGFTLTVVNQADAAKSDSALFAAPPRVQLNAATRALGWPKFIARADLLAASKGWLGDNDTVTVTLKVRLGE